MSNVPELSIMRKLLYKLLLKHPYNTSTKFSPLKKMFYLFFLKYPLIFFLTKTPLVRPFTNYMSNLDDVDKKGSIIFILLKHIFWNEYYAKLKSPHKMRKIVDLTIKNYGFQWSHEHTYYETFLDKNPYGEKRSGNELYEGITQYIKNNNLSEDEDTYIIQIGSLSGKDLKFIYDSFPKLNYVSTDISEEILNLQKKKYTYPNFKFFKCYAEGIDECIKHYKLENKKIIIVSIGTSQYIVPGFLKIFFDKLKSYKNTTLFFYEPRFLKIGENSEHKYSRHRVMMSFSHNYRLYAQEANYKIIEEKIIEPKQTSSLDRRNVVALYYMYCRSPDY